MRIQPESYLKFSLSLPIALLAAQSAIAQGAHVDVKPYPRVTDERLEHPDAGDWLMYRRTYDGSGYSPLNQINAEQHWPTDAGLVGEHRPPWRPRNDGDRQSRPDIHHDASKQHHRV